MSNSEDASHETSAVWANHVPVPGTPDGFTVRTTVPGNPDGVEVMLERWRAGSSEPPHTHPGDDMTVVVEGRMVVQFYQRSGDALLPDGAPLVLERGQTGYVRAGRIYHRQVVNHERVRRALLRNARAAARSCSHPARRVHDARYVEDCKLVYVHVRAFAFREER
jgi:quercetin dioxygenase-like cupin family protein